MKGKRRKVDQTTDQGTVIATGATVLGGPVTVLASLEGGGSMPTLDLDLVPTKTLDLGPSKGLDLDLDREQNLHLDAETKQHLQTLDDIR